MKIEFGLNLEGVNYSELVDVPDDYSRQEFESAYREWSREIFVKKTGGAEGCELLMTALKLNLSN